MEKKPTIKTIAQIAGVSHVAVSRALRGCSDISAETTAQILKIAKEIGYTPNAAARSLSSKRSNTIGMIVPAMGENTAYCAVFNEVSATAAQLGYSVMLGSCHRNIELEKRHCHMMLENRVGALIVASCSSDISHIKEICGNTLPVIYIGGKTSPNEEYYRLCDYRYSAALVVEHLNKLGHRDIALFTYYPENLTILQKEEGFQVEMHKRGLVPNIYRFGNAYDTFTAGKDLTHQLIQDKKLPSAIWCASDLMAMGVLNTLRKNGISVPEDVSVIGHDDLFFSSLPNISLTTLYTPMGTIGKSAAELAVALMSNDNKKTEKHQTFRTSLVVRSTSGVAPK